jgi:hypothetical protein
MDELSGLADQTAEIAVIRQRAESWGQAVADRLDRERPGLRAVFLDDSGIRQYASQHAEQDLVRNWIERRLIRARELMGRLG